MKVDGNTLLFGVVGDPIQQIKTPLSINAIFEARNSPILCVPFHTSRQGFSDFWQGIKSMHNVVGFGVTVPHKMNAMQMCDSVSATAEKMGVVNAVRRRSDGGFHGDMFDGFSFVQGLMTEGFDPKDHNVYIYGAGGAATAISYALIDAGVSCISIQNRTTERAEILVDKLLRSNNFSNVQVAQSVDRDVTMVINASSLGMNEDDQLPVNPAKLNSKQIVAEVVANPEVTKFLHEAKTKGCAIHSGIHMITHQMEIIANFIEAR